MAWEDEMDWSGGDGYTQQPQGVQQQQPYGAINFGQNAGWYDSQMGGGQTQQQWSPIPSSPMVPSGAGAGTRYSYGSPAPAASQPSYSPQPSFGGGRTGGTVWAGPKIQNPMSFQAPKFPELPQWTSPEYKPPEEDPNVYWNQREREVGSGFRRAQRGVDQAMMQFNSVDNPAQRAALMESTLEGFGHGIEQVAEGAGARARSYSNAKRAEQLQIYNTQFGSKTQEAMINYQNKIQKSIMDYANQQSVWQMMMNQNMQDWGRQDINNRYTNQGVIKPPTSYSGYGSWRL